MDFLALLIGTLLVNFAQSALPTGDHVEQAKTLTKLLTDKGYTVQRGAMGFLTANQCHKLTSCYANNPTSPYALIYLPPSPGEDVSTYSKWNTIPDEVHGAGMSVNYRLLEQETVIMLGQTYPRSLYYSWVPYLFDRWHPKGWSAPDQSEPLLKCDDVTAEEGARCEMFASLGDSISMMNMRTSGENGQSFASSFAHFMGGHQQQVKLMRALSVKAGVPASIHNVYPLSSERIDFGLDATSDGMLHLGRVTFTENKDELKEYLNNPSKFVTVLRVTPSKDLPGKTFPPKVFSPRVTTPEQVKSEGITHDDLKRALQDDLAVAVKKSYDGNYVHDFALEAPAFEDGYDCIDKGFECNGDIQDTLYPNSAKEIFKSLMCSKFLKDKCPIQRRITLQPDGSDFFIATGVNHNATASALYSSMCMYNRAGLTAIGQFTSMAGHLDVNSYVGSADRYIKSPLSKYLFAVKISRKCEANEPYCLEVSTEGEFALPLNNGCLFIERIYMDEMRAGPSKDATVKPIIYHFSSKRW